jgi:hypothetical protein
VDLSDPTTAALLVDSAFEEAGLPHALYGGLVLAAYGEPRATRDADVAVADVSASTAKTALTAVGVESMIVFEDVKLGGLLVSRLTLLDAPGHTGLNTLDLVTPRSVRFRDVLLSRAILAPVRGHDVRVVSLEDFVVLKALSTRDKDIEDAVTVLRRSGAAIDRPLIEREIETLGTELPDFEVRERYRRILAREAEDSAR